jgi:hypothetical protein
VNIFKLTIENTVEERILKACLPQLSKKIWLSDTSDIQLQEQKRLLATAALSGDKLKGMKLGLDDLLALFRHGGRDEDDD